MKLLHCPVTESRLQELSDEFADSDHVVLSDWSDSSCVTDPDTPAFDIFENGFELAMRSVAKRQNVLYGTVDGTTYFFIGSVPEVQAMLDRRAEEARREVETFKIVNLCDEAAEEGADLMNVRIYSSHDRVHDYAEFTFSRNDPGVSPVSERIRSWLDQFAPENQLVKEFVALRAADVRHGCAGRYDELFRLRIG